jgi:hypothetical protein
MCSCKYETCTCYDEKLAQAELQQAEALKDWERRNEEAVNYHNDELCENEAHEFAHAHEIEDTPGVRAPRTLRPMQERGKPRPPRRYYRA